MEISENSTIEQLNTFYAHTFGMLMIKPDAVSLGIAEDLIEYTRVRMLTEASAVLTGVFFVESINREDLSYMYPDVRGNKLDLSMHNFNLGPSVILTFNGMRDDIDLWRQAYLIRGKTMRHQTQTGLRDSIRGILPIAGVPGDYRIMTEKYKKPGPMTDEDELIMHFNLAHSPDNVQEVAGLLRLISDTELVQAVGEEKVLELNKYVLPYLTRGE